MTDQDRAFYLEHGWVVPEGIEVPAELIERAAAAVRSLHFEDDPRQLPVSLETHLAWEPDSPFTIRLQNYASYRHPDIEALVCWPGLGEAAAFLARADEIRLFNVTAVDKPASASGTGSGTRVGWHRDRAYWSTCTSRNMLTAWIPLVDMTEDMGPLVFLDGSNHWPDDATQGLAHERGFLTRDPEAQEQKLERSGRVLTPAPQVLRRGQVSFHHCCTFHSSEPNRSARDRLALAVHMQDGGNRWQRATHEDGTLAEHPHDSWCRKTSDGDPDYTDPVICRRLWPVDPELD